MSPTQQEIREYLAAVPPRDFASLDQECSALRLENQELRSIALILADRLYGKSSEKLNKERPAPGGEPAEKPKRKPPAEGHGRAPFGDQHDRQTTTTDVPESERFCEVCKEPLNAMEPPETSERGDLSGIRIVIQRHVRKKYGCPNGHGVKTGAPPPPGLVDRAKWTTSTYVFLAVSKYGDHIPHDRMESILKRQGVHLPKSTMGDMVEVVGEKCRPILGQCKKELLASTHLQMDETPLVVVPEEGRGTKRGYLWAYRTRVGPVGHPGTVDKILMEFDFSRGRGVPTTILRDFPGTLQTDGYAGYDQIVTKNGLVRAGCWAHARRPWKVAADQKSPEALKMLLLLQRLWRLEGAVAARIRSEKLSPEAARRLTAKARSKTGRRIVAKIQARRDALLEDASITPKSPLGKALTYLKNQWETLLVFLEDPDVELDTNALERAIRPVAIGRNNWRVAGSPRGAHLAADLFSIIGMCKSLGIDPQAYLTDVLEQVSPHADLAALTPWAWAASRPKPDPKPDTS